MAGSELFYVYYYGKLFNYQEHRIHRLDSDVDLVYILSYLLEGHFLCSAVGKQPLDLLGLFCPCRFAGNNRNASRL